MKWLRLELPKDARTFWKQILTGLWRGVAIYVGTGLVVAVLMLVVNGPAAWDDFDGNFDPVFALISWGLFWPVLLVWVWLSRPRY